MDYREEIQKLLLLGNCCAQAEVALGLLIKGEENDQLVQAAAGLCGGMAVKANCGALSGGALALSLFDKQKARESMIPELVEWFDTTYGYEYGSYNCEDIAGEAGQYKRQRCPDIMKETGNKVAEILKEYGFIEE